jgi:uncharacterized NAD(P)/FAD-binding protein YdhS
MPGEQHTICVIGGGFTGIAAAIACLTEIKHPFRLVIVEAKTSLAQGVAFGSADPMHLLNVRTRDLSVRAGRPGDFLNWAFRQLDQGENNADLHDSLAHTFLPRQLFGEYVRQRFFEALQSSNDVAHSVIDKTATSCACEEGRLRVQFADGDHLHADTVILATSFGLPRDASNGALPTYVPVATERYRKAKSIAFLGSGQTMVDALLTARRNGFAGDAVAISRRGQLPRSHAPRGVVPQNMELPPFRRISSLTQAVRIACEYAETNGVPWQAVFNGLRPGLQRLWQSLPIEEQRRFLRHVRPFWDAHRHRLPLEAHAHLEGELAAGTLKVLRGRVLTTRQVEGAFALTFRPTGAAEPMTVTFDLAFDCTRHRPQLRSPLIGSLIKQGLARADPHGLGLLVKPNGELVSAPCSSGKARIFALGPLCQGSLWEITAVPEIVAQAHMATQDLAGLQAGNHSARVA